jgi:hypothetical protein
MGYVWMIVPVLPIVVGIGLAFGFVGVLVSVLPKVTNFQQPQSALPVMGEILALYGLGIASFYIILAMGAFAIYYMIERRNRHFRRQEELFWTLQKYLASKIGPEAGDDAFRLERLAEQSIFEEGDRPAGPWSVLYIFVTPIVGLIVAYNLTQDLRKHEELQSSYHSTLLNALNESGGTTQVTLANPRVHKRDPVLLLILTAITAGIFWIYWFYILLKDYNEHFQDQAHFEDQILALLKPPTLTRNCATCGGAVPEGAKFCPHCGRQQVPVS